MRKRLACAFVLSSLIWSSACREGGANNNSAAQGPDPEAVVAEINSFTEELIGKVNSASDPAAGIDEAQKLLDARKESLRASVLAARGSKKFQESEDARKSLLECENDNSDRISGIRKTHLERWMRDAAFKSKLDKLEGDYKDLLK